MYNSRLHSSCLPEPPIVITTLCDFAAAACNVQLNYQENTQLCKCNSYTTLLRSA